MEEGNNISDKPPMVIKISSQLVVIDREIKHTLQIRNYLTWTYKTHLSAMEKSGQCAPPIFSYKYSNDAELTSADKSESKSSIFNTLMPLNHDQPKNGIDCIQMGQGKSKRNKGAGKLLES